MDFGDEGLMTVPKSWLVEDGEDTHCYYPLHFSRREQSKAVAARDKPQKKSWFRYEGVTVLYKSGSYSLES